LTAVALSTDLVCLLSVLSSDVRPRTGDSSPILSQLIHQCWDKDPNLRPNFGAVEMFLKNGMAAAANAKHVCNALVSNVGKLVRDIQSLYILEREGSLEKVLVHLRANFDSSDSDG
jgi:hypothetical protein